MHKLNNLGFVIGIFFTIISLILIIGGFVSEALAYKLNFYTGFSFLVFGVLMVFFNKKNDKDVQV
jgi:heme/copper-type cytochrome/quinol oxidase subunit 4